MTSPRLIVLVLCLLLPAASVLENVNNDITGRKTLLFAGSDRHKSPTSIFRDTFKVRNGDQFLASGGAAEPVEVGGGDAGMVADPIPEDDDDVTPGQPRTVRLRQGAVVGVRRHIPQVGDVNVYLGLPYAAPPVGSQRFMPPKTPLPWRGTRKADRFGPVCPQRLPEIDLRFMSAGRMNHIKRLLKFLHPSSQSEDCLYLNIYSPASATRTSKLPVIVLIHGESLEWNAGNPYDGSILAAFGRIIFVTFNFRLGILGFLRPGEDTRNVSNFGLWDQIAALHWVKENIAEFGGNSDSITLLGHGTGAACASLLLVSPAATALFHRAILMSGTALADWALTPNPLRITIDVADSLNCPTTGDDLAACLREKPLSELMSVRPSSGAPSSSHSQTAGLSGVAANDQLFAPPVFAPHIDGAVVPNEPLLLMETYNEIFKRYELLLGTTEWEGYHILDSVSASYGVSERARNAIFRHYTRVRFETRPDSALERILRHYGFRQSHPEPNEGHRNELLDAISDARHTAPLFKTAELHSRVNSNTFVYIFKHRTQNSDFPSVEHSLGGEDTPYVFGLPLVNEMWEGRSFTAEEKKLSEFIMLRWTNFARSGHPHAQGSPRRQTMSSSRKKDSDIEWPFFDYSQQKYLVLDIPPRPERLYRTAHLDFWNKQLPQLMESGWASTEMPSLPHHKKPPPGPAPWELPSRGRTSADFDQNTVQQMYERNLPKSGVVYGEVMTGQDDTPSPSLEPVQPPLYNSKDEDPNHNTSPPVVTGNFIQPIPASTMAYGVVIVVGISFLVVNACAFRYLHNKNRRLQAEQQAQLNEAPEDLLRKGAPPGRLPTPPPTVAAAAAAGATAAAPAAPTPGSAPGGYVERLLRSLATAKGLRLPSSRRRNDPPPPTTVPSETYEAVRHPESRSGRSSRDSRKGRKISTGTMDAHSKVRDWIAQEVVQRCSPGFLRRPRYSSTPATTSTKKDGKTPGGARAATAAKTPTVPTIPPVPVPEIIPITREKTAETTEPKTSSTPVLKTNISASTGSVDSSSTVTTLHRPKVEKVSVAVDATPATRSASVLQQIPIELAKSFDEGFQRDEDEPPVAPQRRRSTTSITLQSPPSENIVVVPVHEDVVVVMPPSLPPGAPPPPVPPPQPLQSFTPGPPVVLSYPVLTTSVVTPIPGLVKNINVTCRDESPPHAPLPPGETLDSIRRRNYPKVLPDHPGDGSAQSSTSARRQSLPPGHVLLRTATDHLTGQIKSAIRHPGPPPPPRVSTLGRQPRRPEPRVVIRPRITSPVQPAGDYGAIGDVQRVRIAAPPDTT